MSFRKNISKVLFPLTCWYAVGVRFRNMFYSMGIIKQEAPHITTIGVGNLSTGGTGKTPHVEYLLRLLADQYPTAMLSRGYKRKTKGYVEDDGSHDPAQLGDEPAMIAAKFPHVKVAVCEKRVEGVRRLMAHPITPDSLETPENPESPENPENPAAAAANTPRNTTASPSRRSSRNTGRLTTTAMNLPKATATR
jgi:tetraacyldisaccharide-1-P 4'-kinase